ncbi:ABC transporter ATP-binding protein [Comamonas aquatica]|jgi:peptide/nickel transport system ATP-binding protein|uniref:Glutathione import ATP-binding protein GsiA n=1 Tax=Comamonas aquatica TaxID=225991 RepID=A0AA35DA47_9BURK|nr:ABC transporter ATP-binding protein [Comamonas aquatica]CAB5697943.1 Glutathione import ATP-binding protein GsiA [Comamonas aquatica]CAB5710943.1 Glutathione import ATP-binding protein GsiA [Comamonas aquatica]CAC9202598.1 Glutathione import ATP-binding protein GsiA [Comamonas aquatica]CAC9688371.1 Glutathione import ATP-binding protein GsiA [Comamonas aquatica]
MTPLVQIEDLNIQFTGGKKPVQAVSGVSLSVRPGEAVALIGESGSGKSVTLRTLLRLHPERKTSMQGKVQVAGHDVLALRERELPGFRGKTCAMIFQDPLLALDPVYPVGAQIVEAIRRHEPQTSKAEAEARALQLFERVSIPSPAQRLKAYPHEMSGGMRQRAMIALALACNPQVLLADEPTTALDATVQIQILLLLRELQRDLGLGIIFVTHDIGAAVEVADRIAVMYAGRIVEEGTAEQLIRHPRHPYTMALLQSRSHGAMERGQPLQTIPGAPPDLTAIPPGCAFAPRCRWATDTCLQAVPAAREIAPGHLARCVRTDEAARHAPQPLAA